MDGQGEHNFLMSENENQALKKKVASLEKELGFREADLQHYRNKLEEANESIEKLTLEMQQQLKILQVIQKELMPTEFAHIPGFEFSFKFMPSKITGGDYFDVFEHENKSRFGVILTSASGYGTSALLLSILLRLSSQFKAKKGAEPGEIIKSLSQQLRDTMTPGNECHVFYGQIDRASFEMSYSLAGNISALHYIYGDSELKKISATSAPIDKENDTGSASEVVRLNPRDRVVLCSKGLLDIKNDKESFGEERFYAAVSSCIDKEVHEVRNEVLYQIKNFLGTEDLPRDLTVFVMEVKDKVIKLARG